MSKSTNSIALSPHLKFYLFLLHRRIKQHPNSNSYTNNTSHHTQSNDSPDEPQTVIEYALKVLNTHDAAEKAQLTLRAFSRYQHHEISIFKPKSTTNKPHQQQKHGGHGQQTRNEMSGIGHSSLLPDFPARPLHLEIVEPGKTQSRGKSGNISNRIAMIHSLAHIESFGSASNLWLSNLVLAKLDDIEC